MDEPAGHDEFMAVALDEARRGGELGEVPVGAVVVLDGRVVGRGCNRPISSRDPTAHAEIVALRDAARAVGNYRLVGSTVYVTIEPCLMCAGALVHARVARLVFGAREPKAGAVVSTRRALEDEALNHRVAVVEGVLEGECRAVVQAFFRERRRRQGAGQDGAAGADEADEARDDLSRQKGVLPEPDERG
jgi:tRNA(Arg) A34 adenosine deaminase TadA